MAKRYTVLVADRATGKVKRFTVAVRPALLALAGIGLLLVIAVLAVPWRTRAELSYLRARSETLEIENANFRAATGQLTSQVWSLQQTVDELAARSAVPMDVQAAVARLPAAVRDRALGGDSPGLGGGATGSDAIDHVLAATVTPPQDTHDVLRLLLASLERRLSLVRPTLERQVALANATPSIWPAFGWLSSGYGYRRDPFTSQPSSHLGLDIVARKGDPVRAAADGTVTSSGWDGGYGRTVTLAHGFAMSTRYAHLSRAVVKAGQQVKRGDIVGRIGSTGRATSAHLHYEIWINGRPVDPVGLLASRP